MELILTLEEKELLREILEQHQHQLLREISRSKHREFKVELKNKERLLESLISKLKTGQPGALMMRSA